MIRSSKTFQALLAFFVLGSPVAVLAADEPEAMAALRAAAEAGDAEAQLYLGRVLAEREPAEAVLWIRRAADAELAEAEAELGFRYLEGRGVPADEAEGVRWLRRAADGGERLAMWQLAELSCRGLCPEAAEEEAIGWYRRFAAADPEAPLAGLVPGVIADLYWRRARRHEMGVGVAVDRVAAYFWDAVSLLTDPERSSDLAGDAERLGPEGRREAERRLRDYATREGIVLAAEAPPLAALAAAEARRRELWAPAEAGEAAAQLALARRYERGDGVERDPAAAVEWYRRAAEQGVGEAAYELYFCYAVGRGVEEDEAAAGRWKLRAAELGWARAQVQVGMELQFGYGEIDDAKAVGWYRRAAEQGYAHGEYALGLSYAEGKGVERDDVEAVRWFRRAAEQDLTHGQLLLGTHLAQGRGVARDVVEAAFWLGLAARKEVEGEPGLYEATRAELSPAERTDVEGRIERWLAAHREDEEPAEEAGDDATAEGEAEGGS